MRRPRSTLPLISALLVPLACGAGACSGRPMTASPAPAGTAARDAGRAPAAAPAPAPPVDPAAATSGGAAQPGRTPLGAPQVEPLPFVIEPSLDGRSVLFLSDLSSDRVGWVRRLDAATGELGPPLQLVDEDLAGALSSAAGGTTLLTSQGDELCATAFLPGETSAASRACAKVRAHAMAAMGERVALLELDVVDAAKRDKAAKDARRERAAAAKAARKAPAAKRTGKAPGARDKATDKKRDKATDKKRDKRGADRGRDGRPRKNARPAPRPKRPDPLPEVEVRLRWISPGDGIAATSAPTGLRFRPPLDGMGLIDAGGRPGAIDLLYYAASSKKTSTSWLGSAQIAFASLGEDGKLDPGRRAVVVEGDLEYGALRGHLDPRLVTASAGAVVVDVTGRNGACQATRVAPSLQRLGAGGGPRAVCAVDPARLADATPLAPAEIAALERIAASGARRAPGQPAYDPGLAAWAGDRAYFQTSDGALFSASRADGQPRREPDPFPARRARIAWGALATDGEGLAFAAGQLHRLDARGQIAAAPAGAPEGLGAATPGALGAATSRGAPGTPIDAPERPADRRRAARIGASWWLARTDVVRLLPAPLAVPALRGRAHEGGTALVGGRERGLFLEVLGDRLQITGIDASGALVAPGAIAQVTPGAGAAGHAPPAVAIASPVRAGFDACERRGGGAIVAGVSAADPTRVVALSIDALGRPGAARATSLPLAEGDFAVRLVALPEGGALLSDAARRHVVWLDDDGAELASQPWPADDTGALCVDGQPARRAVPAPSPGAFVTVPELAAPGACVVGDAVWAADGSLRWFGSAVSGLDAQAEAGVARPALAAIAAGAGAAVRPAAAEPGEAPAPAPPGAPACPADMVAVDGGRFCVDRFEAMLVDGATGQALSPDYPSTPNLLEFTLAEWSTGRRRLGDVHARAFPLPLLPGWQRGRATAAVARSRFGARPSGYVTGLVAESACAAAGKRLCSVEEFVTACRGEDDTLYPYGDTFEEGACNVFRAGHPASALHGNASIGHLDPRLNRVRIGREPLLRETGESPRCRSRWGSDAIYDLVGNLDEWVNEPGGAFAGGFYSRSTRAGCEALVTSHPRSYLDYSTGVRCCQDGPSTPTADMESPPGAPAAPGGSAPRPPGDLPEHPGQGEHGGDHQEHVDPGAPGQNSEHGEQPHQQRR